MLDFTNVTEGSADITYNSDMNVYGFQFTVDGVSNLDASSTLGDVSVAGNLVLGFSMTGDFLAAGSGTLASVTFDPTLDAQTLSIDSILVSGIGGASIVIDDLTVSSTDVDACANADGDGLCNVFDSCPLDADNDIDGDGVCGDVDVCPADANDDSDGDGSCDSDDICPGFDDNADADGDGAADACDICEGGDDFTDSDGDLVPDACDGDLSLHAGNNLISLIADPSDSSVSSLFSDSDLLGIIGEGSAAVSIGDAWYGSLTDIDMSSGYWVQANSDQEVSVTGTPANDITYTLHDANNLLSYPYAASQSLGDALPDAVEDEVFAIVGEGVASINLGGAWAGSLNGFDGGSGYWFARVAGSEDVSFEYNAPSAGNARSVTKVLPEVPEAFRYTQSTEQAFYFVESITQDGEAMTGDNWILAYNNGVVVGARMWNGEYTDIPAMGSDSSTETAGYMELGGTPSFKLFNSVTGSITDLYVDGSVDGWANNGVAVITLTDIAPIPSTVTLNNSYPNPFNPSTTISFSVPTDMNVDLKVYDISGRVVSELMGGMQSQGLYEITWDAGNNASGLYFVRLVAGSEMHTQKIMLVK